MIDVEPLTLAILNLTSLLIGVMLGYAIRACADYRKEHRHR